MKIEKRRKCFAICGRDAFSLQYVVLYTIMVITLTTTSTLQENIKSSAEAELLPKAFKQIDKSDDPTLIRFMSPDMVIQEPNAIYLQCLVPPVSTKEQILSCSYQNLKSI